MLLYNVKLIEGDGFYGQIKCKDCGQVRNVKMTYMQYMTCKALDRYNQIEPRELRFFVKHGICTACQKKYAETYRDSLIINYDVDFIKEPYTVR